MNVEANKFQRQRSSIRISDSVQTFLIIRIIVETIRRRLNCAISRDDRSLAALREANAETTPGIAKTRFKVQIQIVSGGHDHCRILLWFSRETGDRSAHGWVSIPDKDIISIHFEFQVLDLESQMYCASYQCFCILRFVFLYFLFKKKINFLLNNNIKLWLNKIKHKRCIKDFNLPPRTLYVPAELVKCTGTRVLQDNFAGIPERWAPVLAASL